MPGTLTKGDVDLNVRVPAGRFAEADAALAARYARNLGSDRNADFAAFEDEHAERPLGVQLTAIGGPYDNFLAQRAVLLSRPDLLAAYDDLKRAHDGRPHAEYRAAKARFFETVVAPALAGDLSAPPLPSPR